MAEDRVPVLIIGAGGAGLVMSLLLRQQGIASTLIERRSDISWVPRARNLNFRTLEVFRGLGLEETVRAAGMPVSRVFRRATLASREESQALVDPTTLAPPHMEALSPEPFYWYCPQNRLEPVLRAAARQRGCDVRYGTELLAFVREDAAITATIAERATGKRSVVRADYLVAADGAHSHVRQTLGIKTDGRGTLPEYFIFIYFRAPWQRLIAGHEADAIQITNPDAEGLFLVAKDDLGMFLITYRPAPGEASAAFTAEHCRSLVEKAIGEPGLPVEIVDVVHFQTAESVAEQFQVGRAFLVGDAAHTMPGYKGLGLNTAIQSVQNLAWKLAAVIRGEAGQDLLATYQAERRPVGRFAAHQSLTGPAAAATLPISELLPKSEDLPFFYPIVGYRYRSDAVLADAAGGADGAKQGEIALLDRQELTGEPGTRVPHVWLGRAGARISTLDLLDGRFVLLIGPDGRRWRDAAARAAASLAVSLAAYRVGSDGDLVDSENAAPAKMGLLPDAAILLRPDGFIAWRTDTQPVDPEPTLVQVLSSILCRHRGPAA